jgi:hypothetical protein
MSTTTDLKTATAYSGVTQKRGTVFEIQASPPESPLTSFPQTLPAVERSHSIHRVPVWMPPTNLFPRPDLIPHKGWSDDTPKNPPQHKVQWCESGVRHETVGSRTPSNPLTIHLHAPASFPPTNRFETSAALH